MNWKVLPSAFTIVNLAAGVTSLFLSIHEHYRISFIFILIAVLFDAFDGFIARLMNCTSDFGKQLDSLADLISFGVAPVFLVLMHRLGEFHVLGAAIAILFLVCGALRLARFNISAPTSTFMGMPITLAGCIISFLTLADSIKPLVIISFIAVLSLLMVSRIPFPSLKNMFIRK